MSPEAAIDVLTATVRALTMGDDREIVVAAQTAQDALDAVKADRLAAIDETAAYELDGSSSLSAWSRTHLHLDSGDTHRLLRSSRAMCDLPAVAEAAAAGRLRAGHLSWFDYGLRHVGTEVMQAAEPWLLDVAVAASPNDLRTVVRKLREAVHPDDLDEAWARGMAREDFQVNAVPDGFHVNGFLNTVTGAKLKAVLDSLSVPREADDRRTGAQRRVDGLDELLTGVLDSGLPSDKGVRPHLSVLVDAETLQRAADPVEPQAGEPAELVGFGAIGPKMLTYLGCLADFTALITDSNGTLQRSNVLNVGRSYRLATLKQRRAVIAQQRGVCATPGCRNTHLEVHHLTPWSEGGRTDLGDLVGMCGSCHRLLHRDLLRIVKHASGALTFVNRRNRELRSTEMPRRQARHQTSHLRHAAVLARSHREQVMTT